NSPKLTGINTSSRNDRTGAGTFFNTTFTSSSICVLIIPLFFNWTWHKILNHSAAGH
ncbi:hypothetical protein AYX13_05644, partial [Cryptococcus neoformans]